MDGKSEHVLRTKRKNIKHLIFLMFSLHYVARTYVLEIHPYYQSYFAMVAMVYIFRGNQKVRSPGKIFNHS